MASVSGRKEDNPLAHTTSLSSTYLVRGSPGASILQINYYKAFGKADHPGLNLAGYGRSGRDHDFYYGGSPDKLKRCTMLKSPIWECCCTSGCISLSCIMSWHWRIPRSDDGKQDRIHRGSCARGTGLESTGLRMKQQHSLPRNQSTEKLQKY